MGKPSNVASALGLSLRVTFTAVIIACAVAFEEDDRRAERHALTLAVEPISDRTVRAKTSAGARRSAVKSKSVSSPGAPVRFNLNVQPVIYVADASRSVPVAPELPLLLA